MRSTSVCGSPEPCPHTIWSPGRIIPVKSRLCGSSSCGIVRCAFDIGATSDSHKSRWITPDTAYFSEGRTSKMPALLFASRGDIAYLTLNRPEVHTAINPELMVQLAQAWQQIASDDAIRVAIITGAGNKA